MKQTQIRELEELAAAIEESEGIDPHTARQKAREMLADLKRKAHQWDHQALLAGNPDAIDTKRN